jgi:hypothetical protein
LHHFGGLDNQWLFFVVIKKMAVIELIEKNMLNFWLAIRTFKSFSVKRILAKSGESIDFIKTAIRLAELLLKQKT